MEKNNFIESDKITGKMVIEELAEIYNQLYLVPGEEGAKELYKEIVQGGAEPPEKSLGHFKRSDRDSLVTVTTPAGSVRVVTLYEREDFELFLQIVAHRCEKTQIPKTQGASSLNGVINWRRIEARQEAFLKEEAEKGVTDPDWNAEFQRFTSDKNNYLDALILLSTGPYSALSAEKAGFSEEEWLRLSNDIRKYHECTHFVCRKLYREKIEPIWDELAADAVGLYAAFGKYDIRLAELFLGIEDGRYVGGRLENYLDKAADTAEAREERLNKLAEKAHRALPEIRSLIDGSAGADIYDMIILLEEQQEKIWNMESL